jgi:hypothetical protein
MALGLVVLPHHWLPFRRIGEDADMTKTRRKDPQRSAVDDGEYMSVEEARVFLAEWAANANADLASRNAVDADKWRRTRPRQRSEYPDELLLAAERDARAFIIKRYGREPESIPGGRRKLYEQVATRCGLKPNTIKNRLSHLRKKAAVRR